MMMMMKRSIQSALKSTTILQHQLASPPPLMLLAKRGKRNDDQKPGNGKNGKQGHGSGATAAPPAPLARPITINSNESLRVRVNIDGLASIHVGGFMDLTVDDRPKNGFFKLKIASKLQGIDWRVADGMDSTLFSTQNILKSKKSNRPFPLLPLRWTFTSTDETFVPLMIKCRAISVEEEKTKVIVEYRSSDRFVLKPVLISVPIPSRKVPDISSYTGIRGQYNYKASTVEWRLPRIDKTNRKGVMEFSIPRDDGAKFFPIKVEFKTASTFTNLKVDVLPLNEGDAAPKFVHHKKLVAGAGDYEIAG